MVLWKDHSAHHLFVHKASCLSQAISMTRKILHLAINSTHGRWWGGSFELYNCRSFRADVPIHRIKNSWIFRFNFYTEFTACFLHMILDTVTNLWRKNSAQESSHDNARNSERKTPGPNPKMQIEKDRTFEKW